MTTSGPDERLTRRWVGAFAILAFAYAVAWPFVRDAVPFLPKSARPEMKRPVARAPRPDVARAVAGAKTATQRLEHAAEQALQARATAASNRSIDDASHVDTRSKDTATACVITLLPEGVLGDDPDLGWMCDEQELWVVNRYLYDRITTRGRGPGVQKWVGQGKFNLAAVALLRARCCPEGEAFSAVQATANCDSVAATLDRIVEYPTPDRVDRYAAAVDCLMERKVQVPSSWARVKTKAARKQFDEFVSSLPPYE